MPKVIWLFGLPVSGKTTLGKALSEVLNCWFIDAEDVRKMYSVPSDFSKEARFKFHELLREEVLTNLEDASPVVVASVTPYYEMRTAIRKQWGSDLLLGYLIAPLCVCRDRDQRGLYDSYLKGNNPSLISFNSAYEGEFDICLNTGTLSIEQALSCLVAVSNKPQPRPRR